MNQTAIISIEISSYWHVGSGQGSGSHLDALVEKDKRGLPFISGKMLKGLLRDAVNRLEQWQQLDQFQKTETLTHVEQLFGSAGFGQDEKGQAVPRQQTIAGSLRLNDAVLPDDLQQWLADPAQTLQRQQLFTEMYSTAINEKGVAKNKSLRGRQVTIPLSLEAEIEWIGEEENNQWQAIVAEALPLIRAVGSQRSRGYGRAQCCLKQ